MQIIVVNTEMIRIMIPNMLKIGGKTTSENLGTVLELGSSSSFTYSVAFSGNSSQYIKPIKTKLNKRKLVKYGDIRVLHISNIKTNRDFHITRTIWRNDKCKHVR